MKNKINLFFDKYPSTTLPFVMLCLSLFVLISWNFIGVENYNIFLSNLKMLVNRYGLIALFVGGFIETLFMVGAYLPGSIVIVISVGLFSRDLTSLFVAFLCIITAALFTNFINFYLGKTGLYKIFRFLGANKAIEKARISMEKNGFWSIVLSGIHPNLLGIMVAYAGLSGKSFLKTILISILSTVIWVPILMVLTIFMTDELLEGGSSSWFVMPVFFLLWIASAVVIEKYKIKKSYDKSL